MKEFRIGRVPIGANTDDLNSVKAKNTYQTLLFLSSNNYKVSTPFDIRLAIFMVGLSSIALIVT